MSGKHTPGPWSTTRNFGIVSHDNQFIGDCYETPRYEMPANATLIAAAPSMFDALEVIQTIATKPHHESALETIRQIATNAINQAQK